MRGSNEYIFDGEGFFPKDGKKISKSIRSLIVTITLGLSLAIFIIEVYSIEGLGTMWKATISWIATITTSGYIFYTIAYALHFRGKKGLNPLPNCIEDRKILNSDELERDTEPKKNIGVSK